MSPAPVEPKTWTELIVKFGVPAALTVYLVIFLAEKVDTKLDALVSSLSAHSAIGEHQSRALDKLIELSREQCVNQASMARRSPKECLK